MKGFWLTLGLGAVLGIIGWEIFLEIYGRIREWREWRGREKAHHEKPE